MSGFAVGPYPGTFTETVTTTYGPLTATNGFRNAISLQAEFTITSLLGTVTGSKTLSPTPASATIVCNPTLALGTVDLVYVATIITPNGSATDTGTSQMGFSAGCLAALSCSATPFGETFVSTGLTLNEPTTADQCKNGGWQNYPSLGFKNQGDCVSYVATHGRNPPG